MVNTGKTKQAWAEKSFWAKHSLHPLNLFSLPHTFHLIKQKEAHQDNICLQYLSSVPMTFSLSSTFQAIWGAILGLFPLYKPLQSLVCKSNMIINPPHTHTHTHPLLITSSHSQFSQEEFIY